MSRDSSDPRALREMIREAARDEVPDLAWDRIESRIFAELDESGRDIPVAGASATSAPLQSEESPGRSSLPPALPATAAVAATREGVLPPAREHGLVEQSAARSSGWGRWVAAVAVAAALGGLWLSQSRDPSSDGQMAIVAEPIDPEKIPFAPGMDGRTRDLTYLKPGDVVEAAVGPLAFGQLGTVGWTLSAGSRLIVRESLHVVELENGSMRGTVAAGTSAQLVIAAGQTQIMSVAAGSVFSVTRSSRRVVVHLEQGSATVGPRSVAGSGGGRYLEAPMLAAFSLDGGSSFEVIADAASLSRHARASTDGSVIDRPSEWQAAPDQAHVEEAPIAMPMTDALAARVPGQSAASSKLVPPVSAAPADASAAPIEGATPAVAVLSTSALRSTLVGCLSRVRAEKQKNAADGVRVLVDSVLAVKVQDDGSVKSAVFSPPLAPELQSCAVFLLRAKLEPGARTVSIPVTLP